jgi:hypothetical protein
VIFIGAEDTDPAPDRPAGVGSDRACSSSSSCHRSATRACRRHGAVSKGEKQTSILHDRQSNLAGVFQLWLRLGGHAGRGEVLHDTLLSRDAGKILCVTYTPDDARAYVAAVRWQLASTMPQIPHWYTVRKWRPDLDSAFVAFVRHIRSAGIRMDWPDPPAEPLYHNQYLLLDAWKYWTMGDPHPGVVPPIETPENTTLINRARMEPQVENRIVPPSIRD